MRAFRSIALFFIMFVTLFLLTGLGRTNLGNSSVGTVIVNYDISLSKQGLATLVSAEFWKDVALATTYTLSSLVLYQIKFGSRLEPCSLELEVLAVIIGWMLMIFLIRTLRDFFPSRKSLSG